MKFAANGGNVAQTVAGIAEDVATLRSPTSTPFQKLGAAVSLASEFAPVSVGDVKDAAKVAKEIGSAVAKSSYGKRVGDFTKSQKNAAIKANAEKNGGVNKCSDCGKELMKLPNSKGSPQPQNQLQIHHDPAIKDGGGKNSTPIVLCPLCHKKKHK